jgi:UTP--glucose-1-phosphate uridylyltransferase
MKITKAIIPVAGWGARRLPITKIIEKCMLPIGNRPIVDYIVEDCVRGGITDIYFVINETKHSQLKAYYGEHPAYEKYLAGKGKDTSILETQPRNINFHYSVQPVGKYGTAVPIAIAVKDFNLNEPVVMCNGDDPFYNVPSGSIVKDLVAVPQKEDEAAIMGVERSREEMPIWGNLIVENGLLKKIDEKPELKDVVSTLANINLYVFSPKLLKMIVDYVDNFDVSQNPRGEYEVTDPVSDYCREGNPMRVAAATGDWLESGSLKGWLHANEVIGRDLLKS